MIPEWGYRKGRDPWNDKDCQNIFNVYGMLNWIRVNNHNK